jgi:hypothetical protein
LARLASFGDRLYHARSNAGVRDDRTAAQFQHAGPLSDGRRADCIQREPDSTIAGIVSGWPQNFDAKRAMALGFTAAEKTFEDIIRIHVEDELRGTFVH